MGRNRNGESEEDHEARVLRELDERRERVAAAIKKAIDKEGIEHVLADILLDPYTAKMRFSKQCNKTKAKKHLIN